MVHDRNDEISVRSLALYHLRYDFDTGRLFWVHPTSNKVATGDVAGTDNGLYIQIQLDGVIYKAHRLIWLMVYGHWPKGEIDHWDRDGNNNVLFNLRDVTSLQNSENIGSRNGKCGVKGVAYDPKYAKKPYRVQIERYKKVIHRSHHVTIGEAKSEAKRVYQSLGISYE